jgi:hypothetical protein
MDEFDKARELIERAKTVTFEYPAEQVTALAFFDLVAVLERAGLEISRPKSTGAADG